MKKFFLIIPTLLTLGACAAADPDANVAEDEQALIGAVDCSVVLCASPRVCEMQNGRPVCVDPGTVPPVDVCEQKITPGRCLARIPRWGFDQESGQCKPFLYSGCQGNANNFPTQAACERRCEPGIPERDPCATVRCLPGYQCVPQDVACVQAPCLPVGRCVPKGPPFEDPHL
jgi:hypothetical protein